MDQRMIEAVDLLYAEAKELERQAQVQLDCADRLFRVVSALHDIVHEPTLRSVS